MDLHTDLSTVHGISGQRPISITISSVLYLGRLGIDLSFVPDRCVPCALHNAPSPFPLTCTNVPCACVVNATNCAQQKTAPPQPPSHSPRLTWDWPHDRRVCEAISPLSRFSCQPSLLSQPVHCGSVTLPPDAPELMLASHDCRVARYIVGAYSLVLWAVALTGQGGGCFLTATSGCLGGHPLPSLLGDFGTLAGWSGLFPLRHSSPHVPVLFRRRTRDPQHSGSGWSAGRRWEPQANPVLYLP